MASDSQTLTDLSASVGAWVLDPAQTSIVIHTKAVWFANVTGTARAIEGSGTVGTDGNVSGAFVVDAASIDTKNAKRDAHLRTADFFEIDSHPTITFAATSGQLTPSGQLELVGTLTVHGQTEPLTLVANVSVADSRATLTAEIDIDRSRWGLTWAKMGAGLKNHVVISAVFDRA